MDIPCHFRLVSSLVLGFDKPFRVGKSTFLSKITKTKSEVASYAFTTLTAIPGVLEYGGAEIQVLDLPGIIEGAAEGKGRGRQVISAAKVLPSLEDEAESIVDLLRLAT